MGKLTVKQETFCEEYLVDLNATRAAGRAGYKDPNIGRQLITHNNVSKKIQKLKDKRSKRVLVDADFVIKGWKLVLQKCITQDKIDSTGANNALDSLAKHLGMFKDKGETPAANVNNNINVGIDFGNYSNEQVRQALGQLVETSVKAGSDRITGK